MHEYNLQEFASRLSVEAAPLLHIVEQVIQPSWDEGPWVAGGSLRRLLMGTDPLASDVDIFFASETQRDEFLVRVAKDFTVLSSTSNDHNTTLTVEIEKPFLVHQTTKDGVQSFADAWGEPVESVLEKNIVIKLQAIHIAYYPDAAAVIDSFDFTICQLVTDGSKLLVGSYTLFDLGRKRLALHRLTYGVATTRRMIKYAMQGFYACPGMMADLLSQVAEQPELIGEDFAYID